MVTRKHVVAKNGAILFPTTANPKGLQVSSVWKNCVLSHSGWVRFITSCFSWTHATEERSVCVTASQAWTSALRIIWWKLLSGLPEKHSQQEARINAWKTAPRINTAALLLRCWKLFKKEKRI